MTSANITQPPSISNNTLSQPIKQILNASASQSNHEQLPKFKTNRLKVVKLSSWQIKQIEKGNDLKKLESSSALSLDKQGITNDSEKSHPDNKQIQINLKDIKQTVKYR